MSIGQLLEVIHVTLRDVRPMPNDGRTNPSAAICGDRTGSCTQRAAPLDTNQTFAAEAAAAS